MTDIPEDHPRAISLKIRHDLIEGMHAKIVTEAGLIAHGRGEAYDYLIGEKSHDFAIEAIKAAAALIYISKHPVLSINGNIAILCPNEMIEVCDTTDMAMEVNLFYRKAGRLKAIEEHLTKFGAKNILGLDDDFSDTIDELSSFRRIVDKRGIKAADTVLVPLEDGDRTSALKRVGKKVITVDLNPLSRTSQEADITIVDNVTRVFPILLDQYKKIKDRSVAEQILEKYDNQAILRKAISEISKMGLN